MAAVAQEKGLSFGEAIGKELGIVDGKKVELPAILSDKPSSARAGLNFAAPPCAIVATQVQKHEVHAVGVAPVPRPGGAEPRGAGQQGDRGPAREQIHAAAGAAADREGGRQPRRRGAGRAQAAARGGHLESPGIPEPWVEVTDEKTGKVYYGNTKTGATQWARPE